MLFGLQEICHTLTPYNLFEISKSQNFLPLSTQGALEFLVFLVLIGFVELTRRTQRTRQTQ